MENQFGFISRTIQREVSVYKNSEASWLSPSIAVRVIVLGIAGIVAVHMRVLGSIVMVVRMRMRFVLVIAHAPVGVGVRVRFGIAPEQNLPNDIKHGCTARNDRENRR